MKPGDRVMWLCSPGRSFLTNWRVQSVPGVIVRVCQHRLQIRVNIRGREGIVDVDPENVVAHDEAGNS